MSTNTVDFNLHEFVRVRLVDANPGDVKAVQQQLGFEPVPIGGEPDIQLRFVRKLNHQTDLRLLGVGEWGFDDQYFYALRGAGKADIKVTLPVDQFGERCEFVCESGLRAVPFLIAAVNLRALIKGALPLHACGFEISGRGVLCAGWSKGGKTETLLGFMAHGASYVGDEWLHLDGELMRGVREPIHVWDWHLTDVPALRKRLDRTQRIKLWWTRQARRISERAAHSGWASLRQVARRLVPRVRSKCYVKVAPEQLFGSNALQMASPVDHILFVHSHASEAYVISETTPEDIARRMVHSLLDERNDIVSLHNKFRFAFPFRQNRHLATLESIQMERLTAFLAGRKAHVVYHPYPMSPQQLFEVIAPVVCPCRKDA